MHIRKAIAGVVLAGGRSSRMGTNKALLPYRGRPLIEHMIDTLRQAGCSEVYVSGDVPGYDGISDETAHEGPAQAISGLLKHLRNQHDALLFVAVDMPLLTAKVLKPLLTMEGSNHYEGHPLPAVIETTFNASGEKAVRKLLLEAKASSLELPIEHEIEMTNVNTQKEWNEVVT